jgi:hypothetical protein
LRAAADRERSMAKLVGSALGAVQRARDDEAVKCDDAALGNGEGPRVRLFSHFLRLPRDW